MLQQEYLLSKFGSDTAENEPSRVLFKGLASYLHLAWIHHLQSRYEPGLADHHADLHEMHAPVAGLLAAVNDSATDPILVERFDIEPYPDFSAK